MPLRKAPERLEKRAGLSLPIRRVQKTIKRQFGLKVQIKGSAALCAGIEVLLTELINLAAKFVIRDKVKVMKPRHIYLGIESDHVFKAYLKDVILPQSGRVEFVHPYLLLPLKHRKYDAVPQLNESRTEESSMESLRGEGISQDGLILSQPESPVTTKRTPQKERNLKMDLLNPTLLLKSKLSHRNYHDRHAGKEAARRQHLRILQAKGQAPVSPLALHSYDFPPGTEATPLTSPLSQLVNLRRRKGRRKGPTPVSETSLSLIQQPSPPSDAEISLAPSSLLTPSRKSATNQSAATPPLSSSRPKIPEIRIFGEEGHYLGPLRSPKLAPSTPGPRSDPKFVSRQTQTQVITADKQVQTQIPRALVGLLRSKLPKRI